MKKIAKLFKKLLLARSNFYKWVDAQDCTTVTANGLI